MLAGIGGALTYLQADGCAKAPVRNPKKLLGPCVGGAVRFTAAGRRLGIAEGIETGLSVRQAQPDLPVWAALSAVGMMRVEIPDHVRELVVLADGDEPGEAAAQALARRPDNAGRLVRIARAPPGLDFNDLLQGEWGRAAHG
jgi:putative DNA primase/helicase